jgi:hypothetical protein
MEDSVMDSCAFQIQANEKSLHTKFGVNQTYSDQVMLWTSLLRMKINEGQQLKNHEMLSTTALLNENLHPIKFQVNSF